MWSQLRAEDAHQVNWDGGHAWWSDLVGDVLRRLLRRIRRAGLAITQAAHVAAHAGQIEITRHDIRTCPPGILAMPRSRPRSMADPGNNSPRRYFIDDGGRRVLIGLTVEETFEFERLDQLSGGND